MTLARQVAWYVGMFLATLALVVLAVAGLAALQQLPGMTWTGDAMIPVLALSIALLVVLALRLGSPRGIAHAVLLAFVPVEVIVLQIAWPFNAAIAVKATSVAQITLILLLPVAAAYITAWAVNRSVPSAPSSELADTGSASS